MGIFQFDSGFMKVMDKISRIVTVNILFLFTCIPVITIGIAFEAMYYTLMKWAGEKDDRVLHNYLEGIKQGWLRATAGWVLLVGCVIFMTTEFRIIGEMPSPLNYVFWCVAGFTAVCVGVTGLYYFAVSARVKAPVGKLITISFAGGMRCLFHTLALVMLLAIETFAVTFSVKLVPIWVVFGFVGFGWIQSTIYLWVFEKIGIYKPQRKVKEDKAEQNAVQEGEES